MLPSDSIKFMQWRGPYVVESGVGADDYRVKTGSKSKTYHVNILKKYINKEPEVDMVHTSNMNDATCTLAVARDFPRYWPRAGEVPDLEGYHQKEGGLRHQISWRSIWRPVMYAERLDPESSWCIYRYAGRDQFDSA